MYKNEILIFYLCPNLYAMLVPTMTTEEVCKENKE